MKWVLLLEDEPLQIKLVTDLLKAKLGLNVRATECLDEVVNLAKENPALIISDIVLIKPDSKTKTLNRGGIYFAQSLKNNPETSHIPLMLRSSLKLQDFGVTLAETCANAFVTKTTSSEEFIDTVKKLTNS